MARWLKNKPVGSPLSSFSMTLPSGLGVPAVTPMIYGAEVQ